jgi:hypothetical protein
MGKKGMSYRSVLQCGVVHCAVIDGFAAGKKRKADKVAANSMVIGDIQEGEWTTSADIDVDDEQAPSGSDAVCMYCSIMALQSVQCSDSVWMS